VSVDKTLELLERAREATTVRGSVVLLADALAEHVRDHAQRPQEPSRFWPPRELERVAEGVGQEAREERDAQDAVRWRTLMEPDHGDGRTAERLRLTARGAVHDWMEEARRG